MTKALDLNYRLLIATFIVAIPVHLVNAWIVFADNLPYFLIFVGLVIVGMGLVHLFHHLMEQNRSRKLYQNILTLGNVIMVIGSVWNLLNYLTHGL